jgi:uncharacterized membrane protein YcaP (DUF421 family)
MLHTALRTLLGFTIIVVLTRILGKKQLSQLTIFTYITGIVLGEMVGMLILDNNVRVIDGILALVLWSALVLGIEVISLKSGKARTFMDGEPEIVIKKGEIIERSLKIQRLNLDDLAMQLRLQQVFSVKDVEYAILETNGALTIMKKSGKDPVTREDMNIPPGPVGMPSEIITDGKIVEKNLPELGYTRRQLDNDLRAQGVTRIKDVLYAELQQDRSLYVQLRRRKRVN